MSVCFEEQYPYAQQFADLIAAFGTSIFHCNCCASLRLGQIEQASGQTSSCFLLHAVDALITDGIHVAVINRANNPGKGKPALPGGFIDPLPGNKVETPVQAAIREADEEIGLKFITGSPFGARGLTQPVTYRVAWDDRLHAAFGIKKDDLFTVTHQVVVFNVPDLTERQHQLTAGSDAVPNSARLMRMADVNYDDFAISGHVDMILKYQQLQNKIKS